MTLLGLCVGGLALLGFVAVKPRSSPLLNPGLSRNAAFVSSGLPALITLFSVVGATFLISLYLGYVQHLSALQIALRLLFVTSVAVVLNPFVGALMHRMLVDVLLVCGLTVAAAGVILLAGVDTRTSVLDLGWCLAVIGVAVALILTTVSLAAVNSVPWQQAGMATAGNTALRQFGSALGPAVMGTIFVDRMAGGASPTSALHPALIVNGVPTCRGRHPLSGND